MIRAPFAKFLVPAAMFALGLPAEASNSVHTVVFDGTTSPGKTWYTLKVSDRIEQIDGSLAGHNVTINPNDSVNGDKARRHSGLEPYRKLRRPFFDSF